MKKVLFSCVFILTILLLAGCQRKTGTAPATETESTPLKEVIDNNSGSITTEQPIPDPDNDSQATTGSYINYDPSTINQIAENNQTVLFFHAQWCPYCRAAEEDINARLFEIPKGVAIVKVDYDTETELKKKYGITSQHTFVLVDENLNEVEKWNGGELDEILENVN